ncbi:hypothetical protein MMC27_006008 [Xylographa pallens]|nr:hypothetical protein [Xylographa pallens]
MLGITTSSSTSLFDSTEHDRRTEMKRSVSDIAKAPNKGSASTNFIQCEKIENIVKDLAHPAALPQLSKTEMVVSIAQSKYQLTSERETVGIGTHEYDEPCIVTEDRACSSADEESVQNAQAPSASGLEGRGDDCEIAELQWRNTMWKSLNAERRKRSKISSALGKLRSTTAWQKATLLDKIRMNELEICRVSSFAGRSPSTLSKHCNEICPLSEKRKSGARFVTGVLRDFTKSLEMTADAYGDISTTIEEGIEAGLK